MVKSIRWRLQLWYALILLLVVAGFASVLYYQIGRARFDEIDADLHAAARALEGTLRALPPQALDPRHPPPRKGPRPPPVDHLLRELMLPPQLRHPEEGGQAHYFAIWRNDGRMLRSTPTPGPPPMPEWAPPPGEPYLIRERGSLRELILAGPHGTTVLVGRDVFGERRARAGLGWTLLLTGLAVWAVGLVGGWVLSSRLLRPIETITATAATISAGNLSQRFDIAEVDSELGRLAGVLNATFARLEGAFAQQTRFTADASHELRTPLAVIRSQAELSLSRPRSPEEYKAAIDACLQAAKRMTELVERLLLLARADAGLPNGAWGKISLDRVVAEAVGLLKPLAAEKDVTLSTALAAVTVSADAVAIAQVASNLIANAIQYNHHGGQVRIQVKADGRVAVLTVKDTGTGIGPEDVRHIFERFYRADKARARATGGTGLGLAICKSIVEAHGGHIECESVVGKGTTFRVRLPLAEK